MKSFPLADLHDLRLHIFKISRRQVVLVTGTAVYIPLHEWLLFNIQFPQTVQNEMNMNVAASVMPVAMRTDEDLVPGKTSFGRIPFQAREHVQDQANLPPYPGIKAQDVMMRLDIIVILVFVVLPVQHFTFLIERKRRAVDSVQDKRILIMRFPSASRRGVPFLSCSNIRYLMGFP